MSTRVVTVMSAGALGHEAGGAVVHGDVDSGAGATFLRSADPAQEARGRRGEVPANDHLVDHYELRCGRTLPDVAERGVRRIVGCQWPVQINDRLLSSAVRSEDWRSDRSHARHRENYVSFEM